MSRSDSIAISGEELALRVILFLSSFSICGRNNSVFLQFVTAFSLTAGCRLCSFFEPALINMIIMFNQTAFLCEAVVFIARVAEEKHMFL